MKTPAFAAAFALLFLMLPGLNGLALLFIVFTLGWGVSRAQTTLNASPSRKQLY